MNLVIALLSAQGYLSAERIKSTVVGYGDSPNDEAFSRMFERDKNELRDLGIPLETGRNSTFDANEGYRINRDAYALPDISLSPEEATAVAVATQLWETPELVTATQGALLKLRAAGVDVESDPSLPLRAPSGLVGAGEDALGVLVAAAHAGQAVQFDHRSTRSDPLSTRTVEPWGVVTHRGRWYLIGHDRLREDTRTFRLSRIVGPVRPVGASGVVQRPDGLDLRAFVARAVTDPPTGETAQVWVAEGRATALRRAGKSLGAKQIGDRTGEVLELDIGYRGALARTVAGYGADAVVLEPTTLRDDVLTRLRAAAGESA